MINSDYFFSKPLKTTHPFFFAKSIELLPTTTPQQSFTILLKMQGQCLKVVSSGATYSYIYIENSKLDSLSENVQHHFTKSGAKNF